MYIGDVFIHGGSPGHAMIVIDAVQNPKDSTDKTLVVAEGYMPAQDMHIVLNNRGDKNTPWWSTLTMLQDGAVAFTTYWFDIDDTKTFKKLCSVRTTKTSVIPDEYKVVLSNFGQNNIDCKIKNRKSLCIL